MGLSLGIMEIPTQFRGLKDAEFNTLTRVFQRTLPPRHEIFITNGLGFENRPFTVPGAFLAAVFTTACTIHMGPLAIAATAALQVLSSWTNYGYFMNVGQIGYDANMANSRLLVHEAAHVWQGHNSLLKLEYVAKSAFAQCVSYATTLSANSSYVVTPGKEWGQYNPEQQATIIDRWFKDDDALPQGKWFRFIRDNVRTGKNR